MHAAAPPSPLLDVLPIDVPPGPIEPSPDSYHVLDLHAGDPVRAFIRLDGRQTRAPQLRGDINIVPAGTSGRWLFEGRANALLLRLAPKLYEEAAETMRLTPAASQLRPTMCTRDPHIAHIAWMLQDERQAGYPRGTLWLESAACAIALRLVRRTHDASRSADLPERTLPKWRLTRVCDYIEANLDRNLSLTHLAAVAGFSIPHFKVLFMSSTGLPVHRYVVERRVERARQLISRGKHPMANIALDVGFAHQAHMTRCLQRVLGISPTQILALYGSAPKRATPLRNRKFRATHELRNEVERER